MQIDILELLQLIGQKEVAILQLSKQVSAQKAEIERLTRVVEEMKTGKADDEIPPPTPA